MLLLFKRHKLWFPIMRSLCLPWRHISGKVAVTGIQPTGIPHLGNYLGAIKPCMNLQRSGTISSLLLIIVDLHALTSMNKSLLSTAVLDLACILHACFSDHAQSPGRTCSIFLQSSVRGHSELAWILGSNCSMSRLAHLPQWRDKSGFYSVHKRMSTTAEDVQSSDSSSSTASVGLFTYPVLQAADILLYGADVVPVGADQTAHIELARDLVRLATARWPTLSDILRMPTCLVLGTPKISSLRNPAKKMSKSDSSESGCIYLTDSPDQIRLKIRRAQTDSQRGITYNAEDRPGVANLLHILSALENRPIEALMEEAVRWDKETLKSRVTDSLIQEFSPIRTHVDRLKGTSEGLSEVITMLNKGQQAAECIAQSQLSAIYSAIGCGLPYSAGELSRLPKRQPD